MSTTTARAPRRYVKIAAAVAVVGAIAAVPVLLVPDFAQGDSPGHSTRGDRHGGRGSYGDEHDVPNNPTNRSRQVHAIPADRESDSESGETMHDICAYKPYFYSCR